MDQPNPKSPSKDLPKCNHSCLAKPPALNKLRVSMDELAQSTSSNKLAIPLRDFAAARSPTVRGALRLGRDHNGLGGTREMETQGREPCQHRCEEQAAEGSEEIPSRRVCECNSFQRETSKRLYQVQLSHCAFHLHTLARQSGVTAESPFTVIAERSIIKVN